VLRFSAWLRGFAATSSSGMLGVIFIDDPVTGLGQNPLQAPSVFNWFRPSYAPPGVLTTRGLVGPEFQITHDTTVTGYTNFMINAVNSGYGQDSGRVSAGYAAEKSLAANADQLLDRLNLLLHAGQMTAATRTLIKGAVESISASDTTGRAKMAIALSMVSPEFVVQK
jgi:hypothetical protein